jgi:hypothetical protein
MGATLGIANNVTPTRLLTVELIGSSNRVTLPILMKATRRF